MQTRVVVSKVKAIYYVDDVPCVYEDLKPNTSDLNSDDYRPPKRTRRIYATSTSRAKQTATKTKVKKVHRGKNVGKLSKLTDMPVDIFCEIAGHLSPFDLLQLARSTRVLNRFLMSRESKPLWRAARRSDSDIPDCPPDLSEPEYARLLFEKNCHICLITRVKDVDWFSRSRICEDCRTDYILSGECLINEIPGLTEEILKCMVSSLGDYWHGKLQCFYIVRVKALMKRYRIAVPQGMPENEAIARRDEFLKQQQEWFNAIPTHMKDIGRWARIHRENRIQKDAEATARRQSELRRRLLELGYEENDMPVEWDHECRKIMKQPRDVTPRIWNTVRSRLEACVKKNMKVREDLLRYHRLCGNRTEVANRLFVLLKIRRTGDMRLCMQICEALKLPTVRSLVLGDTGITEETWDVAKHQIQREMDEYSENIRLQLIHDMFQRQAASISGGDVDSHILNPTTTDVDPRIMNTIINNDDVDFLHSPLTFFECSWCHHHFQYPAMLKHVHTIIPSWNPGGFVFSVTAISLSTAIIESIWAQGVHHEIEYIVKCGFQCMRCDPNIQCPRMSWVSLVNHYQCMRSWYDCADPSQDRRDTASYKAHDYNPIVPEFPLAMIVVRPTPATDVNPQASSLIRPTSPPLFAYSWPRMTRPLDSHEPFVGCPWDAETGTNPEILSHINQDHLDDALAYPGAAVGLAANQTLFPEIDNMPPFLPS